MPLHHLIQGQAGQLRDMFGNVPIANGRWVAGQTGTHPLRGVPMSRPCHDRQRVSKARSSRTRETLGSLSLRCFAGTQNRTLSLFNDFFD